MKKGRELLNLKAVLSLQRHSFSFQLALNRLNIQTAKQNNIQHSHRDLKDQEFSHMQ